MQVCAHTSREIVKNREQLYGSTGATKCTENKISRWIMKAQEQRLVGDAKIKLKRALKDLQEYSSKKRKNVCERCENIIEEGARTEAGSGAYVGASVTEAPIKILKAVCRTAGFKRAW
jgi:hypothetical protein